MKVKLDDLDRAIVDLLIKDGRMTSTKIAAHVGNVSAKTVSSRIDRLVREGIIRVTALVDREAIGYPITADVLVETEPTRVSEVAEVLGEIYEVGYIGIIVGAQDISIQLVACSLEHLQKLITETIQSIPGVRRSRTYVLTQRVQTAADRGISLPLYGHDVAGER